jgi:hypothetical protein
MVLGLLLFGGIFAPAAIWAAPNDPIMVDPHSGLAISGFDPVAYFVDAKPEAGRPNVELRLDDTVWRFKNEGNRAAFAEHPEVYAPRFGGFDPVAIARGASVPGNPFVWVVVAERLYLFYDDEARTAFLADPGAIIERATRKWPEVARTIGR